MNAASPSSAPPVLVRLWRGDAPESAHRGSWVVCDAGGAVLDGAGDPRQPVFARSSIKAIQALPLVESGAAERFGLSDAELALALASHDAEPCHLEVVKGLLARLGLSVSDLGCGAQPPRDEGVRAALLVRGEKPSALHNNCSGKHAGFLALAKHLGFPVARYLDPGGEPQRRVRAALCAMAGVAEHEITHAIDGCSAPTLRLPLAGLATAFARLANPSELPAERREACLRMQRAVKANPVLIAGSKKRICTDLVRASQGRLFPKIGAEGVFVIGVVGEERGLALKIEDGGLRALHALVLGLARRFELLDARALAALEEYAGTTLRNWAGLEVGRTEVLV